MATQTASGNETAVSPSRTTFLSRKRSRKLQETLLAYLLLLPAVLIIFTFGLFPLAFSAYESTLRGLNKIVGTYDGLGNYVRAIDNLAYVLGFWLAILLIFLAIRTLQQNYQTARQYNETPWLLALPAAVLAGSVMLFGRFFFRFLPELLGISDKMRAALQANEGEGSQLFRRFLGEIWTLPEITQPFTTFLIVLFVALGLLYAVLQVLRPSARHNSYFTHLFQTFLYIFLALFLAWLTWSQIQVAYAEALEEGTDLEIWSQIITISAGFVLLGLSWWLWGSANGRSSNLSTFMRMAAAIVLAIGAWVLIAELPRMIAAGDEEWWQGLLVTVYYSVGSIPFQFIISLTLATFLFQNIKGKGLFRVIYFLPYITPAVGAAAAFRILFSGRVNAPVNQVLTTLGFEPLGWLNDPNGIFQLMLGESIKLPDWAAGPSLSLVVVIIFGIWTFIGFNTVVFLAGLGNIPGELYEAASIDGAGRWAQFRHITLPLLSPTLYFLTLYAVIGTFKAFNHIIVLRNGAALGTTDTASIVIFDTFQRDTRIGYAAALAILLLMIVMGLTVINNRIASRRVFYG